MSRARPRDLFAAVAVLFAGGCAEPESVPFATIVRGEFVREVVAEGALRAEKSTPLTAPAEIEGSLKVVWLAPDGALVAGGEPVARFDEVPWRVELDGAHAKLSSIEVRAAKQRAAATSGALGAELDAGLAARELEISEQFQARDEDLFSRHERIESELDAELARRRRHHFDRTREVRGRVAAGEAELLAIERRQSGIEIERAESGLKALVLVAPHAGLVVFKRNWRGETVRVGDSIWPGQPIAEIPERSKMEAEVWVLEADAGGLAVGAPANVRLDAWPGRSWSATISQVDKVAKPRIRNLPVQYFGATLALAETDEERMKPGQRVHARLELQKLSGILLVPAAALFEREGNRVVFRRSRARWFGGARRFVPVVVEVAGLGGGLAALSAGVDEGDEVALADPEAREIGRDGEDSRSRGPSAPGTGAGASQ